MKSRAFVWILDAIFPKQCVKCSVEGHWVCATCEKSLTPYQRSGCVICKKQSADTVCRDCASHSPISFLFSAYSYTDPCVRKMVYAVKYEYISDIGIVMGQLLGRAMKGGCCFSRNACIIPIPIHRRRLRDRGFNQADIIGRACAQECGAPYFPQVLQRDRDTPSQVDFSRSKRLQNIIGAFSVSSPDAVRGKQIILIDDVCTTGATLFEAAKVLKSAEASDVIGATFAREE